MKSSVARLCTLGLFVSLTAGCIGQGGGSSQVPPTLFPGQAPSASASPGTTQPGIATAIGSPAPGQTTFACTLSNYALSTGNYSGPGTCWSSGAQPVPLPANAGVCIIGGTTVGCAPSPASPAPISSSGSAAAQNTASWPCTLQLYNNNGTSAYSGPGTCGTTPQTPTDITSTTFTGIVTNSQANYFSSCLLTLPTGGNSQGWCLPNPRTLTASDFGASGAGSSGTPISANPDPAILFSNAKPANLTLTHCNLSSSQCATQSSAALGSITVSENGSGGAFFTAISSNPNIVYVITPYMGGVYLFFGLNPGTATITFTDSSGNTAMTTVIVQ